MNKPRNADFQNYPKKKNKLITRNTFSAPTGSRCFFLLKLLDSDAKNQKLQ
jgi:hypothetical protein